MIKEINISLLDLIDKGEVQSTGIKPKLPINVQGINVEKVEVYRIPLKYLYYNDENGRISSGLSRDNTKLNPSRDDIDSTYNKHIEQIIIDDNKAKLNATKKSIKEKGQQIFGYVLNDGRVIDGNRRFTSLRLIERETKQDQFFEAVILPFSYDKKAERKEIKKLELAIQMGTEARLEYDPMELALDVYNTIIIKQLISEGDYAKEANMKISDVKVKINAIDLTIDFLKFINAKENAFYIVKDANIYTVIEELSKKLNMEFKVKNEQYEQSKTTAFTILLNDIAKGSSDTVKVMREYEKKILKDTVNDDFNYKLEENIDDLRDSLEEKKIESFSALTSTLANNIDTIREINNTFEATLKHQKRSENKDNFIEDIKQINRSIKEISRGDGLLGTLSFSSFSQDDIKDLLSCFESINKHSNYIISVYEDEIKSKDN